MLGAVVVAAIVVIVVVVALLMSRRRADPVDSFRRQIDALSPEARRPTISQAHGADDAAPDEAVENGGAEGAGGDPDGPGATGDPDGP